MISYAMEHGYDSAFPERRQWAHLDLQRQYMEEYICRLNYMFSISTDCKSINIYTIEIYYDLSDNIGYLFILLS